MFEFLKAVGIMRGVFIIKLACMGTIVVRIQGQRVHQAMSHSNKLCVCLRGTELEGVSSESSIFIHKQDA